MANRIFLLDIIAGKAWCSGHEQHLSISEFSPGIAKLAFVERGHFCKGCRKTINSGGYKRKKAVGVCVRCKGERRTENSLCSRCRTEASEYDRALRLEILEAYGKKCQCPCRCSTMEPEFLALDHIFGGGGAERKKRSCHQLYRYLKKLGFPKDQHRLLCHNCNQARGIYGYCPREKKQ